MGLDCRRAGPSIQARRAKNVRVCMEVYDTETGQTLGIGIGLEAPNSTDEQIETAAVCDAWAHAAEELHRRIANCLKTLNDT